MVAPVYPVPLGLVRQNQGNWAKYTHVEYPMREFRTTFVVSIDSESSETLEELKKYLDKSLKIQLTDEEEGHRIGVHSLKVELEDLEEVTRRFPQ